MGNHHGHFHHHHHHLTTVLVAVPGVSAGSGRVDNIPKRFTITLLAFLFYGIAIGTYALIVGLNFTYSYNICQIPLCYFNGCDSSNDRDWYGTSIAGIVVIVLDYLYRAWNISILNTKFNKRGTHFTEWKRG